MATTQRSTIPRGSHLYRCLVFDVPANNVYDVRRKHYRKSQAAYTDASIYVSAPCYVQFHRTDFDKIPIYNNEESLTLGNFKFRNIFIGNENDFTIRIRLLLLSDNVVA